MKTIQNLEDEEFSDKIKTFAHWKYHEDSRSKTVFHETFSSSRKPAHNFFFAKHQKSSIFNTDLLQIGINPGSDCDFPEIHPTLGDNISELRRS